MEHKIYGLYASVDEVGFPLIRYVGYTSKTLKTRLIQHLSEARKGFQSHRCKWIRSVVSKGEFPKILLLETVNEENWSERERFWIARFGVRLTNDTAGGDGLINPSIEVRNRISRKVSKLLKGNSRRSGIGHTPETKERISQSLRASAKAREAWNKKRGIPLTDEAKAKISAAFKGKEKSESHRAAMRAAAQADKSRSIRMQGVRWATDGISDVLVSPGDMLPTGYRFGRSKQNGIGNKNSLGRKQSAETIAKRSATVTGFKWINDGFSERKLYPGVSIPDGWSLGRIKRAK